MSGEPVSFLYDSGHPGPKVLMFGAVHGNETCGTVALARLKLEIELGILSIGRGTLTLVPVCNPLAYRAGKRYVHENLNRIIAPGLDVVHDEHGYARVLMALIDEAEILLDLHSYSAGTLPFISYDYDSESNRAIAESLDIGNWVTGWTELYAGKPELNAGDTIQYANEAGKAGVLVECGRHDDPASANVAYSCARRTLATLGMIQAMRGDLPSPPPLVAKLRTVIVKDRNGEFARDWQNFDTIEANEPLVVYPDGETLRADRHSVVIFPDSKAPIGGEWIYLGERQIG